MTFARGRAGFLFYLGCEAAIRCDSSRCLAFAGPTIIMATSLRPLSLLRGAEQAGRGVCQWRGWEQASKEQYFSAPPAPPPRSPACAARLPRGSRRDRVLPSPPLWSRPVLLQLQAFVPFQEIFGSRCVASRSPLQQQPVSSTRGVQSPAGRGHIVPHVLRGTTKCLDT